MKFLTIVVLLIAALISTVGSQSAYNCGDESTNTIVLQDFSLEPSPIPRPSIATFHLIVDIKEDLADPIQTDIRLDIKKIIWIKVPCTDDVGSCSYKSWCDLCKTCVCPLKAGVQRLSMTMNVTDAVPSGQYRTEINFLSASGQTGCVHIDNIRIE